MIFICCFFIVITPCNVNNTYSTRKFNILTTQQQDIILIPKEKIQYLKMEPYEIPDFNRLI